MGTAASKPPAPVDVRACIRQPGLAAGDVAALARTFDPRPNPLAYRLGPRDLARALCFLAPADLAASAASCARWREHAEGEPVWRDACARVGRVTKTTASSGVCESWRAAYRDVVATRFERGWRKRPGEDEADRADYDVMLKVAILGDGGVGKSCFLLRFVDDFFTPTFISTIGVDFKLANVTYRRKRLKLQLWDTAGPNPGINRCLMRGASALLVVFDHTDRASFEHVNYWLDQIWDSFPEWHWEQARPGTVIVLVGTKLDLVRDASYVVEDAVTHEDARAFAAERGIEYVACSSRTGENVEEVIVTMLRELAKPDDALPEGSRFDQLVADAAAADAARAARKAKLDLAASRCFWNWNWRALAPLYDRLR